MTTQIRPLLGSLALLGLLSAPPLASAYYDPGVQRWINRDPTDERGGINLYNFTFNSPKDGHDAYGLKPAWLPPLPPLPPWWPTDPPFPYPLPNWPGATCPQRYNQCIADCNTAYNNRVAQCYDMYGPGTCPYRNPILCAIDTVISKIDLALCMGDVGVIRDICIANCNARGLSPWN